MVFRETFSSPPSLPDWTAPGDGCSLFIRVGAAPAGSAHLSCLVPSLPFLFSTTLLWLSFCTENCSSPFLGHCPAFQGWFIFRALWPHRFQGNLPAGKGTGTMTLNVPFLLLPTPSPSPVHQESLRDPKASMLLSRLWLPLAWNIHLQRYYWAPILPWRDGSWHL